MRQFLFALIFAFGAVSAAAQITAVGFDGRSLTAYTNGASNDSIYFYCDNGLGTLVATPSGGTAPYDFAWQNYSTATNAYVSFQTENDVLTSTLTDLQPGGYRVTITDANGNIVGCDRAWISQVLTNPSVNVNPIPPGCGSFQLNGQITYGTATPYYNPPPDPMIIGANTQITVCFSGNHSFVSDIGFYFRGPASCGSPTITLSPNPGTNCNAGDNIANLCFTNQTAPNFNVCGAPTPLTGTYDSYGAGNTVINWTPLNGCNASSSGWQVQIYDCVGADVGALTDATITFVGQDACGQPQTITYTTPAGFSSTINDNSCTAGSASVYTVPGSSTAPIAYTNGYQWTASPTWTIPNATSSLTPTVNPAPSVDTQYTLTITGNGPGAACGGNISDTETRIYQGPTTPVINPVEPFYCIGQPNFNLTATPAGGQWSGPGIVNATTGLFNTNAAGGPGLKTITYTVGGIGCQVSTTVQINLLQSVNSSITNNPGLLCGSTSIVDLNAAAPGGTWSGTGIIDAAQGLFDPTVSGFGTFTITYTIPNVCNGTSTTEMNVAEPGDSQVNDPGQICSDAEILNLVGTPGGGTWSGTGIVDPTTGAFDPALAGPGTFTVNYTFANCVTSSTFDVVVTESVNIALNVTENVVCESEVPFDIAFSPAGGTWSGSGITDNSLGTFSAANANIGLNTLTYSIPNVCNGEASITIEVLEDLTLSITDPGDQCVSAAPFNLQANVPGGIWSGDGITNASSGNFNPNLAGNGEAIVEYQIPNTCSDPVSITINVSSFIDATIAQVGPFCSNDAPVQLTAASSGGVWSGTGVTSSGLFTPANANAGNNTIQYTINDVCTGTDDIVIAVQTLPVIDITTPANICINASPLVLTATPAGGVWSGVGVSGNNFSAGAAGLGSIALTYSISGVCEVTATENISVNPLPTVVASEDQEICAGATATVSATGAATYQWSPGGANPTGASNTVQPNTTTTYTVTGTSALGCQNSDQVVVVVNPLPNVSLGFVNTSICEDESVQLSAGGLATYSWNPASSLTGANTSSPTASPVATTTYTVTGQDNNGCAGSASVTVNVTQINLSLASSTTPAPDGQNNIIGGLPLAVDFVINSNGSSFDWDFDGDGEIDEQTNATTISNTFNLPGNTQGTVTANLNGCSETIDYNIVLFTSSDLIVPNVISANGDGSNDRFYVRGNFIKSFELKIYNRNGQLIATLEDIDEMFDDGDTFDFWNPRGEFNDGTYYIHYEAEGFDGKIYSKSGFLTVLQSK